MNIEQLGNLGEFVAAIAVLVSLFYLSFQVRQNTRQQRLTAHRDTYAAFSVIRTNVYSNPEFANLLTKSVLDNAELDPADVLRLESFFNEFVFCNVNLWRLYKEGIVENSVEAEKQTLVSVAKLLASPVARKWWQEWKALYPKEFADRIEKRFRTASNVRLKPQLRSRFHCLDVVSRRAYCIRNLCANFLRRMTGCYTSWRQRA